MKNVNFGQSDKKKPPFDGEVGIGEAERILEEKNREIERLKSQNRILQKTCEWYAHQFCSLTDSRSFRLVTHLKQLVTFTDIAYDVKQLLKVFLSEKQIQRIRRIRQQDPGIPKKGLFAFRKKRDRLRESAKPFFQTVWDMPLITVVVPCYNHGAYLDELIHSLDNQTFTDFETVLIDDGSTDPDTLKKIEEIKRFRKDIRVIRQENAGVIEARNKGIGVSNGKYIFALDSDDFIEKTFLEKCALFLESAPDHYFVYSWFLVTGKTNYIFQTTDTDAFRLLNENRVGYPVFPKKALCRAGGYNSLMKEGYEDWELNVHLLREGYAGKAIPELLYTYREKTGSRNDGAKLRHELLKQTIHRLHKQGIYRNAKKWEAKKRQRYDVKNPLVNILGKNSKTGEKRLLVDLYDKRFDPLSTFSRILDMADSGREKIAVTVDLHFRAFFDLNPRENLFVYYPENYHPDGCVKTFYSYLEQRFDLQKFPVESMALYPAEFEKKKKREEISIAYIAPWLIIGGSDSMTIDWFKAMDTPGFRTFFLSTEPRVNAWIYQIRGLSQGIYDLPGLFCKKPEEKIRFILERIEKCQIQVVQVMNSEEGFRALSEIKKKFPRVKTVAQFHCFDYLKNRRKTGFPYSAPARYDPCIDYYNVESYSLKSEIRELYPFIDERKFRVIHACVDTQKYDPDKDDFDENVLNYRHDDKLNILFVGRLDRQKRPMTMVKTAHDLKKKGYPVIFHVLGEGSLHSEERRIRRYIRQNRLYDVVKLHGFQPMDTLPSWYKLADVLLLTSAWEGIPVVLYQAMSMGVVCLAPKMDSICEILDENTGILVENGEDPEEYTRCVIRLLENRDRLKEKGFEARKKMVEHFDVKNMERKYRAFYREIVNEN